MNDKLIDPVMRLREELAGKLVGRSDLIDRLLIALLCQGHVLIEGAPGLAKTRAVKLFSQGITADFSRIQFTPDLLPADLTGTRIFLPQSGEFDFQPGPLFANIILADEINRAPPKVQSALLEVMAERQITVSGRTRRMADPFMVVATQNTLEHEGTYPLPEAQLDRFLFCVQLALPALEDELEILDLALAESTTEDISIAEALNAEQLHSACAAAAGVFVSPAVRRYIAEITMATRQYNEQQDRMLVEFPASPRASIGLAIAARARAWLADRDHVLPEDVFELAPDVLRSRIGMSYQARAEGVDVNEVIANILETTAPL